MATTSTSCTSTSWKFYIIENKGFTYAGVSPNPVRRLRQHNCEIKGGAKYTTSKGNGWKHICLVTGFRTKNEALQFEWAVKHASPRNVGGIKSRIQKLYDIFHKEKWTSKSPNSSDVPLVITWKCLPDMFHDLELLKPVHIVEQFELI